MNAPEIHSKNTEIKTLAAAKRYVLTIKKTLQEQVASAAPMLQAMAGSPTCPVLIPGSVKRLQSSHCCMGRGQDSRKRSFMEQGQLQVVSFSILQCSSAPISALLPRPHPVHSWLLCVQRAVRKTAKLPATMIARETEVTSNSSGWFQGETAQF